MYLLDSKHKAQVHPDKINLLIGYDGCKDKCHDQTENLNSKTV